MSCMIDIDDAAKELGLKYPVSFTFTNAADEDPLYGALVYGSAKAGMTAAFPGRLHEVTINLDVVKFAEVDLRKIVAHELVHCQQYERRGSYMHQMGCNLLYQLTFDYDHNPDEVEARVRSEEIAPLITFSDCGSDYPFTMSGTQRVLDELADEELERES